MRGIFLATMMLVASIPMLAQETGWIGISIEDQQNGGAIGQCDTLDERQVVGPDRPDHQITQAGKTINGFDQQRSAEGLRGLHADQRHRRHRGITQRMTEKNSRFADAA